MERVTLSRHYFKPCGRQLAAIMMPPLTINCYDVTRACGGAVAVESPQPFYYVNVDQIYYNSFTSNLYK